MFIVWRSYGILVPIVTVVAFFVTVILADTLEHFAFNRTYIQLL